MKDSHIPTEVIKDFESPAAVKIYFPRQQSKILSSPTVTKDFSSLAIKDFESPTAVKDLFSPTVVKDLFSATAVKELFSLAIQQISLHAHTLHIS